MLSLSTNSFRGEQAHRGTDDLKQQLASKLAWMYNYASYVLGDGDQVPLRVISDRSLDGLLCYRTLVVIGTTTARSRFPDIASVDLKRRKDRIKNIWCSINLSGPFQPPTDLVRQNLTC